MMRVRPWDNPATSIIIFVILVVAALVAETELGRGIFRAFDRVRLRRQRQIVLREGPDGYTFV